jgi:hypothetical protein
LGRSRGGGLGTLTFHLVELELERPVILVPVDVRETGMSDGPYMTRSKKHVSEQITNNAARQLSAIKLDPFIRIS